MFRLTSALGAAALALSSTTALAETAEERGAAKFAELTEGRVAGEPKSCVSALRSNDIEVIENVGIAYEQGDTLWIARATDPRSLGRHDVPIIDRFGSQLCRQDVIRTVDRYSQFVSGVVFLEDFVPYTKQG
jgi:hypothetical protein